MKVTGSFTLNAPISRVWEFLMDANSVAKVMPGCKELKEIEPDIFAGKMSLGVAAVKGDYSGTVKLLDKVPPTSYRMLIDGNGKRGFVKGEANVELEDQGQVTLMTYDADTQIGGLIANVGQRMMNGAAKLIISQSLKKLQEELSAETQGE